jgi:hypothetical protein
MVRYQHIPNADLGERNAGFNGILGYFGFSFFFVSQ